jgi:hypothetical protein
MKMRTIEENIIQTKKHEVLDIGGMRVNLQRTTRVPVGKINSLPAGLGSFPIYKVSDFRSGCPKQWRDDSYFFPMYRQEAMWLNFGRGYNHNAKALIVGAGNINAVTGKPFDPGKRLYDENGESDAQKTDETKLEIKLESPQNYLVVPPQPWLDGWKAEDGKIYQFVAAEMGSGETVEGQITGEETVGGIQLIVFDATKELINESTPHEYVSGGFIKSTFSSHHYLAGIETQCCYASGVQARGLGSKKVMACKAVRSMGLGRGGEIRQKIYPDPYGVDVWKKEPTAVEVIYMVSSEDFRQVTGHEAPPTPVQYEDYQKKQMPWFDLHDENLKDTKGNKLFEKLKPVGEGKAK